MASTLTHTTGCEAQSHSAHLREGIQEQVIAPAATAVLEIHGTGFVCPVWATTAPARTSSDPAATFTTAPELSPLFSACVADALTPVFAAARFDAVFMEIGGGSGAFRNLLAKLLANDALPSRYATWTPVPTSRAPARTIATAAAALAVRPWVDGGRADQDRGMACCSPTR